MKEIVAEVLEADIVSPLTGLYYPRSVLETAVRDYQSKIDSKRALGCFGEPQSPEVDLARMSHKINALYFRDDNVLMAHLTVIDTPVGVIAQT